MLEYFEFNLYWWLDRIFPLLTAPKILNVAQLINLSVCKGYYGFAQYLYLDNKCFKVF